MLSPRPLISWVLSGDIGSDAEVGVLGSGICVIFADYQQSESGDKR